MRASPPGYGVTRLAADSLGAQLRGAHANQLLRWDYIFTVHFLQRVYAPVPPLRCNDQRQPP